MGHVLVRDSGVGEVRVRYVLGRDSGGCVYSPTVPRSLDLLLVSGGLGCR